MVRISTRRNETNIFVLSFQICSVKLEVLNRFSLVFFALEVGEEAIIFSEDSSLVIDIPADRLFLLCSVRMSKERGEGKKYEREICLNLELNENINTDRDSVLASNVL